MDGFVYADMSDIISGHFLIRAHVDKHVIIISMIRHDCHLPCVVVVVGSYVEQGS